MAPIITIGVLCDQLTSLDELTDDEDQLLRDRLRTLVLGFLSERMKKILTFTKDEPGSEPENVLVDGVIKVQESCVSSVSANHLVGHSQIRVDRHVYDSERHLIVFAFV